MESFELFLAVILLIILGEVTFMTFNSRSSTPSRRRSREILLDTSVIMDGRIVAVAKTGFIGGTLVIPRSVIGELQFLADAADHEKRARARAGLDIVAELQALPMVDVTILQDGAKADEGVDQRLLNLAKKRGAAVCTLDYNLNKVALVEDIAILNVNELAQSLRMAHLPGERLMLELVQKGQDGHQAVGYLPDGTMVVVEHANKQMGQTVEVEVIRSLQTAAGRMMFAKQVQQPPRTTSVKAQVKKQPNNASVRKPARAAGGRAPAKQQHARRQRKQDPESELISLVERSE